MVAMLNPLTKRRREAVRLETQYEANYNALWK